MEQEKLLSVKEVAEHYAVDIETVYRWLHAKQLRGIKLTPKLWRIPESAITEFQAK